MRRMIRLGWISLLASILAACAAPRPIKYYSVQIPAAPVSARSTYPIDLLVGSIDGPSLLRSSQIVYRIGPHQIGTYQYHRWEDPPVLIVQQRLIRMLQSSGNYRTVSELGNSSSGEWVIRGRLDEFAEVDGSSIEGRVTMQFELVNRNTGKIHWNHFYTQVEPVQGKEVPDVVSALDRNLDRGLKEVAAELNKHFAANSPRPSASVKH